MIGELVDSSRWDSESNWDEGLAGGGRWLKPTQKDRINVLGMVTLNDLERLERAGKGGMGWIACEFFPSRLFIIFTDSKLAECRHNGHHIPREATHV